MSKKIIISIITIVLIIVTSCFLFFNNILNKINYQDWSSIETKIEEPEINNVLSCQYNIVSNMFNNNIIDKSVLSSQMLIDIFDNKITDDNNIIWSQSNLKYNNINNVINILLVGVEHIGGGNGRTDSMMIASIDRVNKKIKLTSIMRDCYVQIPGYSDNKLNAAYSYGQIPLLKETLKENFGITIDGSVRVDFESFEKVIDLLGGVDIELTNGEANYLNSHSYISNSKYRNVKEGLNHLNGNQALGYCRIRKVNTIDDHDDFGRTERQRIVLTKLFNTYKKESIVNILSLTEQILPYIETDITKKDIINYITLVLNENILDIEQLRIPLNDAYKGGRIRGMSCLILDFDKNNEAIKKFIYGDIE